MVVEIALGVAVGAYREVEDPLMQIPEAEVKPLRHTASVATSKALVMEVNAVRDIPLFDATFIESPTPLILTLKTAALAIKGAEILSPGKQTIPKPDIKLARKLKKKYLNILEAVFSDNKEIEEKIKKILTGRGNLDLGSDLINIAVLISMHLETLTATGLMVQEEIEMLDPLGEQLLKWVGQETEDHSRDKERRAWTYMARIYDDIREHARFIYRKDLDTWKRDYPNLLAVKSSTPSKAAPKKQDTNTPKTDTQ